jgi:hypothetical protein
LILFGAIVTFVGRKFFAWTIAFIGLVLGFVVTTLLFQMFELLDAVKSQNDDNLVFNYTSFLVSLIIGVFVGFILKKMLHLGAAILGGVGGFFIGVAIYNLLLFFSKSNAVLLVISIFSSLFMAFLSFRFYDKIVIFGTSFIGSYAFVRGISLFLGYFPSEITIIEKMSKGENL